MRINVIRMLAFVWLASTSLSDTAVAQWVNPPSKALQEQTPGLVHETYDSHVMKTKMGYSVVLPPSYETGNERYPVVYWLHGGGGNECSSLFTVKSWRDLYEKNAIHEVILVYPAAYRSGYMDHHDGKVMIESQIINELIPRIDKRFRTIASREGRAMHGFSMGSSGSIKFAIKYPDLFCSVVAYGGGAIDLEKDKTEFILKILERNFKSDPDLVRKNNTYHILEQTQDEVRRYKIPFLLICGDDDYWKKSALDFQAVLREKNIPCDLTLVPETGHSIRRLIEAEGQAAAIFQDKVFTRTLAIQ